MTQETKNTVEGFYSITQDQQLKDLTAKKADQVSLTEEDKVFRRIVKKSDNEEDLSLDGSDTLEMSILLL